MSIKNYLKDNYVIRPMYLSDLDQVLLIEAMAYGQIHWTRDNFISELNNQLAKYIVLENTNNQQIMAYLGAWFIIDEVHITTVATHNEYLRMGSAEVLLLSTIYEAVKNKSKALTLEVRISNFGAQKLYEKYHFERMGTRPKYYEDNQESALIMWTPDIQTEEYTNLLDTNRHNILSKQKLCSL